MPTGAATVELVPRTPVGLGRLHQVDEMMGHLGALGGGGFGGADIHARVSETLIDAAIADDPAVDKMLAVYGPKVRELDNVIGKLRGELRKGGVGAGSLGRPATIWLIAASSAIFPSR